MKKIKNLLVKLGRAYIRSAAEVYGPMIVRRF